jgi:hypothetical protein
MRALRERMIGVRVNEQEHHLLTKLAAKEGLSLAAMLRREALKAARRSRLRDSVREARGTGRAES